MQNVWEMPRRWRKGQGCITVMTHDSVRLLGADAECRTGNLIMGRTGLCGPFSLLFHFLCDILCPYPINRINYKIYLQDGLFCALFDTLITERDLTNFMRHIFLRVNAVEPICRYEIKSRHRTCRHTAERRVERRPRMRWGRRRPGLVCRGSLSHWHAVRTNIWSMLILIVQW